MTKAESHEAFYIVGAVAAIVLLWWVWQKNQPQPIPAATVPSQEGFPIPYSGPMDDVYAANPSAYMPPTDADLTLNVSNPYADMLGSAYMPLFGFVGIAQGVEL